MQDQNSVLYKRWNEKLPEVEMFMNLAKSHSNIFLYGASGVGKTTFAQDILKYQSSEMSILPHIYVDCVEFYSEKLIANYVSLCLDNILKKFYRDISGALKTPKLFTFKTCKNFPQLVDYLQDLNQKFIEAKKAGDFSLNPKLESLDLFFYIVLDNASNVLVQERQKKVVTKLCVAQSLTTPQCFSLCLIDTHLYGGALQGSDIFRDTMPILYEEYMITPIILSPMNDFQLKRIIKEKLIEKFQREAGGDTPEKADEDIYNLNLIYDSMYTILQTQVSQYTTNITEYVYLFQFLFPHYIEPIRHLTLEERQVRLQKPLSNKDFLSLLKMVCGSCMFMHLKSKDDIQMELEAKDDKDFQQKCEVNKMTQQNNQVKQEKRERKIFDYRTINYLETYNKNINFSFLQSICLIAAYLAGANKEAFDSKIFSRAQKKIRQTTSKQNPNESKGQNLLGKTKKFTSERFFAICDYLLSIESEGCREHRNWSRSSDYLACVNSLVEEGLLKRTSMKKGEGLQSEELVQVCYKCNFDFNFIEDVSEKIDFKLNEYLFNGIEPSEAF